ncbi:MAG: DUF5320 domain-containing protein [Alphaproteobacteria bacterium]|nr:DUF5320 domain-containing protein [Alphaproteobacteria bacterium]
MPAHDGTGPFGTGPQGFGRGGCQQPDASFPVKTGRGRGGGMGCGFGQGGCRRGFRNQAGVSSQQEEVTMLESRIAALQARLDKLKEAKAEA